MAIGNSPGRQWQFLAVSIQMQYYINLNSTNNFGKTKRLAGGPNVSKSKQVTGQTIVAREESGIGILGAKEGARKRSKKSVTFSESGPRILNRTMEPASKIAVTNGKCSPVNADESRRFDLVIFAASGCVGKFLVEEMALVAEKHFSGNQSNSGSPPTSSSLAGQQQQFAQQALRRRSVPSSSMADNAISWAIAGRSAIKLSETLCRAELSTGVRGLSGSIPVLLADLNHQKSLVDMCQKSSMVINCAGPYSELGAEVLIQACLETKTHYIDLAHEVTFVELMKQKYSTQAKEAGVFILNGCGFQSMSAEMGLNFTKQVADGTIEQVKIILSMSDTSALPKSATSNKCRRASGIISEGMWNSLLAEKAQEMSVEDRLRVKMAARDELAYQLEQEQQVEEERREKLLKATQGQKDRRKQVAGSGPTSSSTPTAQPQSPAASPASTSSANGLVSSVTKQTKSITAKLLERKDTQTLVKDLVQFRNRSVSLAWPLRLIQSFQGKSGRGYCWPIDNMSSDESQLIRSEMDTYELRGPDLDSDEGWRPIRCSTFLSVKNFTQLSLLFIWLLLFQMLVKFSLFRYAMRKFPQLVSLGHVTSSSALSGASSQRSSNGQQSIERDSLSHIKFCQTFIAYGMPSEDSADPLGGRAGSSSRTPVQLLVSRVVGPEPNHVATATLAIQAAITLLTERDHLPCPGGVLTPGAAFCETNIIYQLRKRNIKFEVLKKA